MNFDRGKFQTGIAEQCQVKNIAGEGPLLVSLCLVTVMNKKIVRQGYITLTDSSRQVCKNEGILHTGRYTR